MKRINSEDKRRIRRSVHARAGGVCEYCGERATLKVGTVDHYLPQALGGTNAKTNLRWACFPCNQRKGDMPPQEWEQRRPVPVVRKNDRIELLAEIARRARERQAA